MSTHYYVISLSEQTNVLYEAFRDSVFDIRNGGFPVEVSARTIRAADSINREERLRGVIRIVDQQFGDYYRHDPLRVVITGETEMLDIFTSVTEHRNVIIGRIQGDYSTTSIRDLGKIVWPVVKEALSGLLDEAMRDLDTAGKEDRVISGLEAVSQAAVSGASGKLLVEDDYHVHGSIIRTARALEISPDVDVMDEIDDAVDVVIKNVLESGGNVIFAPCGSLHKLGRIVLLRHGSNDLQ